MELGEKRIKNREKKELYEPQQKRFNIHTNGVPAWEKRQNEAETLFKGVAENFFNVFERF